MKRFIALTNIVLTFSLLMAGCGPASTPAPPTEEPVSVLTREEAIEYLMVEVIQPSPNADMLVAYGLQEPLSAGDVLQSLLPADSLSSLDLIGSPYSHGEAWFFWIDDHPQAGYAHPTRFVLVDLTTGAVEVTPEEWWPVINGDPCWDTQETRRDSADIVYQGAHPYENENPESALQLVAYHVAAPLPADKTKYAILVRGANEGSPDNSVEAMKAQLIKEGFLQKNIKVVKVVKGQKKADPTGKVVKAFDDVVEQIKKDGTEEPKFLFYYVGHANKNAFVYGKKKESNCEILTYVQQSPNSVVKTDGSLANDSLASILLRIPSKNITVIIDACKSGTAIDDLGGWGFKGQILTGANRDGEVLWSGWNVGRTYFTGYLLEGREKWGSFWEGLNHAAYKCSKWLWYDDPKPQREKLKGDYKEIIISGKVTDKDTGKPIPGATINITGTSPNGLDKITKHNIRADNTGRYKTAVRLIGYFTVETKATGYKSDKKSEGLDTDRPELNFSLTQEMPTSTPTPTPSPTPTLIPTLTSTPTMTPTMTPTPTPTPEPEIEEYVQECNACLEQGKALLLAHSETGQGDCREGIRLLQMAIEQATIALELKPGDAEACFCRGMSRRWLEEELDEAIQDLECAVEGLEGDRRDEAEEALEELREKVAAPICVSMGLPVFAEGWTKDGQPVNPGTTFPADSTREVWAQWDLSNPCGEETVVKWYHDGELVCQHDTKLEDWWEWADSGWIADEEWIELGQWCMSVYIGDMLMTEGCFSIE